MSGLTAAQLEQVASLLLETGVPVAGRLQAARIAGGRSNLSYVVSDGCSRWVLRTPPRSGRTASAHDVAREHRVTAALAATGVPVAAAILLCQDEDVLGVPFTISAFVEGSAVRTQDDLSSYGDERLARVVDSLLESLAALHAVDHVSVGLADFGRADAYAARQLRRWSGQWTTVGDEGLGGLATEVVTRLGASIPEQRSVAIVHGDYRIDNTLLGDDGRAVDRVRAVVDWELSTIGDPVADVAMMCAYRYEVFDLVVGAPSAWTSPRLPSADQLAAGYERHGGATLRDWEFHQALAYFKVAVIAAGIDHRRRAGSGSGAGFDTASQAVQPYLELALKQLGASRRPTRRWNVQP